MQEVRSATKLARDLPSVRLQEHDTSLTLDEAIEMHSATETAQAATRCSRRSDQRQIPLKPAPDEILAGCQGHGRQTVKLVTGISDEKAKEISKFARQAVPKVQTQIQGAQVA